MYCSMGAVHLISFQSSGETPAHCASQCQVRTRTTSFFASCRRVDRFDSVCQKRAIVSLPNVTHHFQLDRFLNDCKQVDISVVINCTTWLGTRTIKCDRKAPIDCGNFIPSENSVHSLCQSQGAQSVKKLNTNLPKVLNESLLNLQIFPPDIDDKSE